MVGRYIDKCMNVFEFRANFIKTKNGNTKNILRTPHYQFDRSNISVGAEKNDRKKMVYNIEYCYYNESLKTSIDYHTNEMLILIQSTPLSLYSVINNTE